MPLKIAFVLPASSPRPSGGFKVVYEYANHLVARGHQVAVVHPWDCEPAAGLRGRLARRHWLARHRRDPRRLAPWFELDPRVELPVVSEPRPELLPGADAYVATAWQTAPFVAAAAPPSAGFYLVQHLEPWDDAEAVLATWRLPLHKIAVAGWLLDVAREHGVGERTTVIPIGLDQDAFGVDRDPAARAPRVGALISPYKGFEDVVAAFTTARERVPSLGAVGYGTRPRPPELPDWVEYQQLPAPAALRALYNSCSIFVQASSSEGWGLPATEAMLCGCALVTYDNGGSREYARDGETALVAAPAADAQAAAIVALCEDGELRLRLARRGRELAAGFTWERAVTALERVLAAGGEGER